MNIENLADTILAQSRDLFWVVDRNYLLVYANESYQALMKDGTGEYSKLNETVFVEGFGEGNTEKWKSYYDRAFKGEYFEVEEHFYHPQTNEIQYGQNTFEPLTDDVGKVYAISCQWKNITKIVKQRSEANQMMDASLDVFCTVNKEGNFVFVSGAAQTLWGYTPEELIGIAYRSLLLKEDIEKTNEVASAVLSGQNSTTFENRYKKKNGEVAYNLWSARWDDNAQLMYCVARDGKEKLAKEAQIQLSEQRFKALVQEGSDMISIIDADGNYIYTSPTTTAILGITPEEFQGKNIIDFIHPDDLERCLVCMQNIANEKKIIVPPFRLLNKNNEWRWIETVLTNMINNPVIKGLVANSRDITDTVNVQKQIEASGVFNRTVLENSPDCVKVLDIDGRIQYMSYNGLCQMEIDDFDSIKNHYWWTLWGSDNEELVKNALKNVLNGEIAKFTAYRPTAKGNYKWWDVVLSPVGNSGDEIRQIISVSRDITERKKEEQHLKLLESVITNTNDAVLITEAEPFDEPGNRIIYVNEAFTKMTGYTAEEVIGKTPRILQGPNSNKEGLRKLGEAIRNWHPYELTTINYRKNGEEFWINFTVTPVADEKGWFTHWIAIERDVTVQKNKELEKELLNKISVNFNSENDLLSSTSHLCETISAFGNFDLVELWITNLERSHLQLFNHYVINPLDEKFYDHNGTTFKHKTTEGLAGKVWKKGAQVLLKETEIQSDFLRKDSAKLIGLKEILGIPLIFQDELIGVLQIGTKQTHNYLQNYLHVFKKLEQYIGSELNRKKLEYELSKLMNAIPDIVGVGDFNGRLLKINRAGCELLGYQEEELLFHSFNDFVHPNDIDIAAKEIEQLREVQQTSKFDVRFLTKSGSVIWLSWQCNPSLEEGVVYFTAKNITEERKLRELNREVGKLTKTGSWEVNLIDKSLFWSDEIHFVYETDPKTFLPTIDAAINFYREDFRELALSNFEQCVETGNPYEIETVIVTSNKKELWVRTTANAEFIDGVCIRVYGSFQDITTRKTAEEESNILQETLESSLNEIYIFDDKTFKFSYVNKGALYNLGYSKNEIETLTPLDLKPSFNLASFKKLISPLISEEKKEIVFFTSHKRKDGSLYPVEVHLQLVLVGDKKRYVAIILDITEREKAETQDNFKANLLGTIGQAVIVTNPVGIVTYWNNAAEQIYGWSQHEAIGKNIISLTTPESNRAEGIRIMEILEKGNIWSGKFNVHKKDGTKFLAYVNNAPVFDKNRVLTGIIGVSSDVTKEAENELLLLQYTGELELANERFEKVTEATNDAIWDWDIINEKFYRSKAIERFFGENTSKKLSQNDFWTDSFHEEDIEHVKKSIQLSMDNPTCFYWESEYRIYNLNRELIHVIDRGVIVRNKSGKAIRMVGAMTNITEQKELTLKLSKLNTSLQKHTIELEKSNEELEQFAFIASHDLQEPLRMISSFMDLLKRKYGASIDEKGHVYIDFAIDGAKKMKQIIHDLLDYSKSNKNTEPKETINLNELINDYKSLRRKLISEKKVKISTNNLPTITSHTAAVAQVFHCIIDNAIKYSEVGVHPLIEIDFVDHETDWQFSIKDNGIGIDAQFFSKIFVIFQRLHNKDAYPGTGIGLSIAKRHIEFLGGKIWLESDLHKGSKFYFTISK